MNAVRHLAKRQLLLLLMFAAFIPLGRAAVVTPDQPVITSLALVGTNLVFDASFPAGVDRAVLEVRSHLAADWQATAVIEVPTNGGDLEFSIPQPVLDTAFFRLNATLHTSAQTELSGEVRYLAVPSLAQLNEPADVSPEAVFRFRGVIDGSERIVLTHQGAFWNHVNWHWPGTVTVNASHWNPSELNFMTTTGAVAFLPDTYSLSAATLEVLEGRDVVALERTNNALIVYLDDTPPGAAPYEFKVHFHPSPAKSLRKRLSPAATLKIAAQIDGSDQLKITARDATWKHLAWAFPKAVNLNDVRWDLSQTNVLANTGTNRFLPSGIDFSTARIGHRSGRDLVTMWADDDAVWISFADNPNGPDQYELEILFGQEESSR